MHWVAHAFQRMAGRLRNLIQMLPQKYGLALLSPISLQLEFQTGQRCVPRAVSTPPPSLPITHCTHFWINQPKTLGVKTSLHTSKYCCFQIPCIFHLFYIGKLHYVRQLCVFPYVHAHVQVCAFKQKPEADIRSLSQSLSNIFIEAGSHRWNPEFVIPIQASLARASCIKRRPVLLWHFKDSWYWTLSHFPLFLEHLSQHICGELHVVRTKKQIKNYFWLINYRHLYGPRKWQLLCNPDSDFKQEM